MLGARNVSSSDVLACSSVGARSFAVAAQVTHRADRAGIPSPSNRQYPTVHAGMTADAGHSELRGGADQYPEGGAAQRSS